VDEAESSINALTILQHGYPTSEYLGIPIFENMLVQPWPDHPEYEFRDISYSERGLAIYHGWLPLYAIAASFRVFGIELPTHKDGWHVNIDLSEFRHRTAIARLPSLIFAAVFLVCLFAVGRAMAGDAAAFAVLVLAGLSTSVVEPTFQARYYALTLALSAAGCLSLWRMLSRGERRDYAVHGLVLVALFYTHLMAVLNLAAVTTIVVLTMAGRGAVRRWGYVLLGVTVCAVPWLVGSGFLTHLHDVPSGRLLVAFPGDLLHYVFNRVPYLTLFTVGTLWLALVWLRHGRGLPARVREPWQRQGRQISLLMIWMGVATATYYLLTPPASLFPQRLSLALFVPGLLFMSISLANAARMVAARRTALLAPLLAAVFLGGAGLLRPPAPAPYAFENLGYTFEMLNYLQLRPDAKVYASPATQLVLTFYADRPVQSLAPIRKTFLDRYPGEVVYIEQEFDWEFLAPTASEVKIVAAESGYQVSDAEASTLALALRTRLARERTGPRVAAVLPELEPLAPIAEAVMTKTRARARTLARLTQEEWTPEKYPFTRGFAIRTGAQLWETFFYRLVDPRSRSGSRLNAADRLRRGCAYFLPSANRVLFYSPAPSPVMSSRLFNFPPARYIGPPSDD